VSCYGAIFLFSHCQFVGQSLCEGLIFKQNLNAKDAKGAKGAKGAKDVW
jgi:hypothetical protein